MSKLYNSLLERYPIPTKMFTSGSLFSIGDAVTQFSTYLSMQSSRIRGSAGSAMPISSSWDSAISHLLFICGIASCCPESRPSSSPQSPRQLRS